MKNANEYEEFIDQIKDLDSELNVFDKTINVPNSLSTLLDGRYLNDEVINMMLNIFSNVLQYQDSTQKHKASVIMNTFFYAYLTDPTQTDHKLMRIIKRFVPGAMPTYVIIPINLASLEHWALAIIVNCDGSLSGKHKECAIREVHTVG